MLKVQLVEGSQLVLKCSKLGQFHLYNYNFLVL